MLWSSKYSVLVKYITPAKGGNVWEECTANLKKKVGVLLKQSTSTALRLRNACCSVSVRRILNQGCVWYEIFQILGHKCFQYWFLSSVPNDTELFLIQPFSHCLLCFV